MDFHGYIFVRSGNYYTATAILKNFLRVLSAKRTYEIIEICPTL